MHGLLRDAFEQRQTVRSIDMKANMFEIYQILIFLSFHRIKASHIMLLGQSKANCARTFNRLKSVILLSELCESEGKERTQNISFGDCALIVSFSSLPWQSFD